MKLFVVQINNQGAKGCYETLEAFTDGLRRDWSPGSRAQSLDEALIATINIAHVGMVLPFRLGWVFCAEDAAA